MSYPRVDRLCLLVLTSVLSGPFSAALAEIPDAIPLYPDGAPGAKGNEPGDQPVIRIYPPMEDHRTGAAVVICPGGGYGILATDHEGHQVARWFARKGVTGVVLRYRHAPRYRHPIPLQDAQRALRYVRRNASRLGIHPARVGIMGFSAGGHLASTVATHFTPDDPGAKAAEISDRPDFAILGYPVISFVEPFGHRGSLRNLLGDNPDPELVKGLSNETRVTGRTPPTFLFHTGEDRGVPVENSLAFYQALVKHRVPAELHVYQNGPHGLGLAIGDPVVTSWKKRLWEWMQTNGFLADVQRVSGSGTVSFGGKPLRWGTITFEPMGDGDLPVASAMISRGKFSIPVGRGIVTGRNRVVIRNLGDVFIDPTIEDAKIIGPESFVEIESSSTSLDFAIEGSD